MPNPAPTNRVHREVIAAQVAANQKSLDTKAPAPVFLPAGATDADVPPGTPVGALIWTAAAGG